MKFTFHFKFFEKKVTLKAYVFLKLQTAKNVVRHYLKSPVSEHPSIVNILKSLQTLVKSAWQHIFSSLWEILSFKISLLVICEILGVFVNTLTMNDKYSLQNSQNLRQPMQRQLSKQQKTFSQ